MPTCACFLASARHAHLQRHLSAKYIEQRRYFDKYQYHSQSTTTLPKFISLAFQLFLQRAVKMGTNAKTALGRFCVKLIARVSAIFLLPVFEKWAIYSAFSAIMHGIGTIPRSNTVLCDGKSGRRTLDGSVTCWFPWKHPLA